MNVEDIKSIIRKYKVVSIYQIAILDFLNSAKNAEQIAGREPSRGPIADDPTRNGRGYDIGEKVANRILYKKSQVGGKFTSIHQLADIPFFGKDKFRDLVYTFMKLRSPVPSGKGQGFDDLLIMLSRLEILAYKYGVTVQEFISMIRKLFYSNQFEPENYENVINLDWAELIKGSDEIESPASWKSPSMLAAVDYIVGKPIIDIEGEPVNFHMLLAGIEAKLNSTKVRPTNTNIQLGSNIEFLGFIMPFASTTYQLLADENIAANSEFVVNQELVSQKYNKDITDTEFNTIADINNIDIDPNISVTGNILNYYTNDEKLTEQRFTKLAAKLNFGAYANGKLSNDNTETRADWVSKMVNGTFYLLDLNGKRRTVNRMLRKPKSDDGYKAYKYTFEFILDFFLDRLVLKIDMAISKPVVMSWNRLEARPRTDDFSRALRAEVRDALWFISRQWQFGEFTAEDTGSALEMRVDMQSSEIQNYSLNGQHALSYPNQEPMETLVESEATGPDLIARIEMGKYFEDQLRKRMSNYDDSIFEKVIADFKAVEKLQFNLPSPKKDYPEVYSNPELVKHMITIQSGRMIDGEALFDIIRDGGDPSDFMVSHSSSDLKNIIKELWEEYTAYYSSLYLTSGDKATSAWNPQQLEHQFHASIPSSTSGFSVLSANEYAHGHLDWYSFDFSTEAGGYHRSIVNDSVDREKISRKEITLLPADLTYPGMPMPRWWQFEDYKLNIGAVKANTNELPKLLMAEFALIYSNDWMLIPFDVSVGSLCEAKQVIVRDVFGQYTSIKPAGQGRDGDWRRWSMFNLNRIGVSSGAADNRLFVPPAVVRTMESDPVEQVSLIRDEMSNMVWGIESKIPDDLGGSMDGANAARRFYQFLDSTAKSGKNNEEEVENNAAIDYKLGTTVPENWIPFIPARKGDVESRQIQLRRAAMPRIIEGRPTERIRPRTDLLRTGYDEANDRWDPYFIYEEEVPRSGVIVKRSWQRARGHNGKNYTWLGRRVTNGRGEANSGLQYDLVVNK